jgi:hypothetical protein
MESHRSFGTVFLPLLQERGKPILLVMNPLMDLPLECKKPVQFHGVELGHWNVAHFRPRFVLEGIIVEKLAPQKEGSGKHSIDLTTTRGIHSSGREKSHSTRQVEKTQKDGGTGKPCRGEDLVHILAKLGWDRGSWVDDSLGHFCHKVRHLVHLVV